MLATNNRLNASLSSTLTNQGVAINTNKEAKAAPASLSPKALANILSLSSGFNTNSLVTMAFSPIAAKGLIKVTMAIR